MSALTALSTMTNDPAMGGGSVIRMQDISELLGHLDSGSCTAEQVEVMAAEHRGPTPAEWAAMRGGVDDGQTETATDEPTPAPEPAAEETPEAEAGGESVPDAEGESVASEDPGSV